MVRGSANHMYVLLHKVRRSAHPERAVVEHKGIDHGGVQELAVQQLLSVDYVFQLPRMDKPSGTWLRGSVAGSYRSFNFPGWINHPEQL